MILRIWFILNKKNKNIIHLTSSYNIHWTIIIYFKLAYTGVAFGTSSTIADIGWWSFRYPYANKCCNI
jgi:hypothetical protein